MRKRNLGGSFNVPDTSNLRASGFICRTGRLYLFLMGTSLTQMPFLLIFLTLLRDYLFLLTCRLHAFNACQCTAFFFGNFPIVFFFISFWELHVHYMLYYMVGVIPRPLKLPIPSTSANWYTKLAGKGNNPHLTIG